MEHCLLARGEGNGASFTGCLGDVGCNVYVVRNVFIVLVLHVPHRLDQAGRSVDLFNGEPLPDQRLFHGPQRLIC
jgi:hypothetical protein